VLFGWLLIKDMVSTLRIESLPGLSVIRNTKKIPRSAACLIQPFTSRARDLVLEGKRVSLMGTREIIISKSVPKAAIRYDEKKLHVGTICVVFG